MAASAATKGFGTTVTVMVGATPTTIGELVAVTPPNKTRETVDVTHMSSPDGYREFLSTLRSGGEATLTFNYTKAGYAVLEARFDDDDPAEYTITFPDDSTFVFDGLLNEQPIDQVEVDGKIGMSATIQATGKPVFTAGS
jgi:hypothetical protein